MLVMLNQRAATSSTTTRHVEHRPAPLFSGVKVVSSEDAILKHRRYGGLLEPPVLYARHLCLRRVREPITDSDSARSHCRIISTWSYISLNDSQHAPQQSGFGDQEHSQPSTTASLLSLHRPRRLQSVFSNQNKGRDSPCLIPSPCTMQVQGHSAKTQLHPGADSQRGYCTQHCTPSSVGPLLSAKQASLSGMRIESKW